MGAGVSVNPEQSEEHLGSPSKIALDELLTRVEADADLAEPFKSVFIADLHSEAPSELSKLKTALATKEPGDAA